MCGTRIGTLVSRRIAAVLLVVSLPACDASPGSVVVTIAAGGNFVDSGRMAIEQELATGPIPGLDTLLIPEPTNRSDVAVMHAEDLASIPGLAAVVGHSNSTSSLAASQIYNAREIIQIAPTSTTPVYSEAGPYSFRLVPSDALQGRFLAGVLEDSFPEGARLGLFYVNDDYGRGLRSELLANLDPERYPVLVTLPHLEEDVRAIDVESSVRNAAGADPDVVVWLARSTVLRFFIADLRRELPGVPIYGSDAIGAEVPAGEAATHWEGVVYSDFLDPGASEELRAFGARHAERTGRQATATEILTYDATTLLLTAIREGHRTGPEIRRWLMSLGRDRPPHEGLSGPISFEADGDVERSYVLRSFGVADRR